MIAVGVRRSATDTALRAARWALMRSPGAYELARRCAAEWSYRRRLPHEADFLALRGMDLAGALVLDVGANRGRAVLSVKMFQPRARVLGLEPNPAFGPALERLRRRFADFDYRLCGLSDRAGRLALNVPVVDGYAFDELATIEEPDLEGLAAWLSLAFFVRPIAASDIAVRRLDCEVVPLDDLGVRPRLVKIDAEGATLRIIAGARATLAESRPLILAECGGGEAGAEAVHAALAPFGYRMYAFDGDRFRPDRGGSPNTWFSTVPLA